MVFGSIGTWHVLLRALKPGFAASGPGAGPGVKKTRHGGKKTKPRSRGWVFVLPVWVFLPPGPATGPEAGKPNFRAL